MFPTCCPGADRRATRGYWLNIVLWAASEGEPREREANEHIPRRLASVLLLTCVRLDSEVTGLAELCQAGLNSQYRVLSMSATTVV